MSENTKFWNKVAQKYSKKPIEDEAAYQKKLKKTQQHLRPDMELLEIGCGTGSTAIIHAPYVKHIWATDFSEEMIQIAKEKIQKENIKNINFETIAIDEIQLKDQSLDAVLALSLLHLLEDKEAVIQKVYSMLKPGGIFVTSTACLGDTMKFFKFIGPIGKFFGFMPLVKVFTTQELVDSLTSAGFTIDYQWQPGKGKAVFIIAKKPE